MKTPSRIGLIGGASPVGRQVIRQLRDQGISVAALSRKPRKTDDAGVRWLDLGASDYGQRLAALRGVETWISVGPIWVLPDYFDLLAEAGAKRIVVISSTSRFTKTASTSAYEEDVVQRLVKGEQDLIDWASLHAIDWTIVRPTLIYGRSTDRNLSEIVRIIRKFTLFPLFGKAAGLRQPIYVDDVAMACVQSAFASAAFNKAYNISGAEVLSYEEMVRRIFLAMGRKPRILRINMVLFRAGLWILQRIPRYKNWNVDMVQRMNQDMVFDHDAASADFDFKPRKFELSDIDVR